MRYVTHTSKVIAGAVLAYLLYAWATHPELSTREAGIGYALVVGCLFLGVHGLFTGFEAAISAVDERRFEQ